MTMYIFHGYSQGGVRPNGICWKSWVIRSHSGSNKKNKCYNCQVCSVVELDRLAGDPLDILVNNTKIAKGEVVMVGERFGVRFGEIVDPEKRVEGL